MTRASMVAKLRELAAANEALRGQHSLALHLFDIADALEQEQLDPLNELALKIMLCDKTGRWSERSAWEKDRDEWLDIVSRYLRELLLVRDEMVSISEEHERTGGVSIVRGWADALTKMIGDEK